MMAVEEGMLEKATELLMIEPRPVDLEERLAALEKRAPAHERRLFARLWEALEVADGEVGLQEERN